MLGNQLANEAREEIELISGTTNPFSLDDFLEGKQTPVFLVQQLTILVLRTFLMAL